MTIPSRQTVVSLLVGLLVTLSSCSAGTSGPSPASNLPTAAVPAGYQTLYDELQRELNHFDGVLHEKWDNTKANTVFATELAFANGNIGEGLLLPSTMESNRLLLDRLQAMGVKGVVLGIKFPILMPDFPRSADYLQFYKNIATLIRQHDMKILVECGAVFAGTPYSPITVS